MPLPIFNLAKTLETHNQKRQHHYALDEDVGFAYFEKDLLSETHAAITIVNTGLDRYRWYLLPFSAPYLKNTKDEFFIKFLEKVLANGPSSPQNERCDFIKSEVSTLSI